MTPAKIKQAYYSAGGENRYFFSRGAMKFFGDRMSSFGARNIGGCIYLYRKADARVNVFGKWQRAGRDFFNAWKFDEATRDINHCGSDITQSVWEHVYGARARAQAGPGHGD